MDSREQKRRMSWIRQPPHKLFTWNTTSLVWNKNTSSWQKLDDLAYSQFTSNASTSAYSMQNFYEADVPLQPTCIYLQANFYILFVLFFMAWKQHHIISTFPLNPPRYFRRLALKPDPFDVYQGGSKGAAKMLQPPVCRIACALLISLPGEHTGKSTLDTGTWEFRFSSFANRRSLFYPNCPSPAHRSGHRWGRGEVIFRP